MRLLWAMHLDAQKCYLMLFFTALRAYYILQDTFAGFKQRQKVLYSLCVCMCVCICYSVCVHVCVYVILCVYVYMLFYVCMCICSMCACVYVILCVNVCKGRVGLEA